MDVVNWMHSHNTYCRDTTIVTESGQPVFCVGDEGFWAGVGSTLEPNAPFEPLDCTIEPVESLGGEVISGGDFGLFEGGKSVKDSAPVGSMSSPSVTCQAVISAGTQTQVGTAEGFLRQQLRWRRLRRWLR